MAMSQTRRLRGALFLALCVFSLWSLGCGLEAKAGSRDTGQVAKKFCVAAILAIIGSRFFDAKVKFIYGTT